MVAILILILGMTFICGGKIDSVIVDKERGFLEIHKTSVICCTSKKVRDLQSVKNIRAIKKGHDGVNFYTLHYVIQAEFRNEPPIKLLESSKRDKIIQQALLIRNYLGMFTTEA